MGMRNRNSCNEFLIPHSEFLILNSRRLPASVRDQLRAAGLRVDLDERQEKIGYKIREAQLQKVPYMLVVGDRESAEGAVSVRTRTGGDQRASSVSDFVTKAADEIARRA